LIILNAKARSKTTTLHSAVLSADVRNANVHAAARLCMGPSFLGRNYSVPLPGIEHYGKMVAAVVIVIIRHETLRIDGHAVAP